MELLENIFLGMFLLGLLFTLASAFLSGAFGHAFGEGSAFDAHGGHIGHMGGDVGPTAHEGQPEVGWAQHDLATFSPLSPTVISAFFTAAGGAGYIGLHQFDWGAGSSIAFAVGAGLAFAAIVFLGIAWLFRSTQASSLVAQSGLVGLHAEVNAPIAEGGVGEVAYVRAGQRHVMPARCANAAAVPQGAKVVIKSVSPTVFVVEETRESWLARSKAAGAPPR